MNNSITVIGVEAEGIRGVRLEEDGAQWVVADGDFWPFGGGEAAEGEESAPPEDGQEASGAASSDGDGEAAAAADRYSAMVRSLQEAAKRFNSREVVLSMPLKSLLVKVTRTSVEERDHLGETANSELESISPFPDETPATGIETVSETDRELVTVVAALPAAEASEIGDALDEAKVRVLRTDVTALGWLRTLWPQIFGAEGEGAVDRAPATSSRKMVLMDFP